MPSPESSPERIPPTEIKQYTLPELRENTEIYESLLHAYNDVFSNTWGESWDSEEVARLIETQFQFPGFIFVAEEARKAVGFIWGVEGPTEEIVNQSVETYLNPRFDTATRMNVAQSIQESLRQDCDDPQSLYWGCEMGVLPAFRKTKIPGRLFIQAFTHAIENGSSSQMYAMTARPFKDKPNHDNATYEVGKIFTRRGAKIHHALIDPEKELEYIFFTTEFDKLIKNDKS